MLRSFLMALVVCSSVLNLWSQAQLEVNLVDAKTLKAVTDHPLKLVNEAIAYELEASSNEQGKLKVNALSTAGRYQVIVPASGDYAEMVSDQLVLNSNQKSTVTVMLFPKTELEVGEVTVKANSISKINTTTAEVSGQLRREEIEALPIEGRDVTRVLFRLPGVVQATGFYPEAPNVSINGANGLYANYMIDGFENNENFLGGQRFAMPVGFTQNINVLLNNYSTEFGLTGNGIINLTSRSGSNDWSAEAFYVFRPGTRKILGIQFDAASDLAQRDLSGNQVLNGFQRHQAGFGLGGALVKDKTFFYVNYEHTTDFKDNLLNSPALGVNEVVTGTNNFDYISAKIDQHWSPKMRSSLRANVGFVGIDRQGGGLEGGLAFPSAGNTQDRNSFAIATKNSYIGDNFLVETNLQYAGFVWDYAEPNNPTSPNVTVLDSNALTAAVLGHPGYIFDARERTMQFQQKFSYFLGKHTVKAGFELINSWHELYGGGNPNGSYTVQLNAAQQQALIAQGLGSSLSPTDIPSDVNVLFYGTELRPQSFGTTERIYSLYVEDQFSASDRLNLTLGLRYDYDNLSKGGADQGDFNNIAPRFNANYRLGEKSSLRFGYGMFYEKILYAIYSDALQQNTNDDDYKTQVQELVDLGVLPASTNVDQVTFEGNLGASADNVDYLQGPSAASLQEQRSEVFSNERRILNPNGYVNPLTHQFALGFQHQLNAHTLFTSDLIHNRSYNLARIVNLNTASAYTFDDPDNVVVRSTISADSSRAIPIYADAGGNYAMIDGDTVRGVARNVVMTDMGGRSVYWAWTMSIIGDKTENGKLAYRVSYTLSQLKNNTEDINFRAEDANDFEREFSYSINDRTHVFNAYLFYFPIKGLSVNAASLIQSGQPINRIPDASVWGTTDLNGDGRGFGDAYVGNSDRYPGEARNSDRLPWSFNFDLGVQYQLPIKESKIEIRLDCFNVFNVQNWSGFSNNATQSNQIQVGPASSGVYVQRNAGAPRQFQMSLRYLL